MEKGTPIKTESGRKIGVLKGSVLYQYVRGRNLFMKVGDNGSWGLDYAILFKRLPERGSVYIEDLENKILYIGRVSQWKEYGTVMHFKNGTPEANTQVFLPIEYFNRVKMNGIPKTV